LKKSLGWPKIAVRNLTNLVWNWSTLMQFWKTSAGILNLISE
jgi:hypothetical protein